MTNRRQLSANNASTTLAADIGAFDTTITLKDASRFPLPGGNQFFLATIDNGVSVEVIEVTSRVGNTLNGIARAQEGTNAAYFGAGSKVEVRVTAGYLASVEDLKEQVTSLTSPNPSLENVPRLVFSDVPGAATPRGLSWNVDEQTLDLPLGATGVTLQIGQETVYRARNETGSPILNGTVVMAAGTLGNSGRILITPGIANGTYEGKGFMGVVTETISNGQDGFVTHFGKVRGIQTDGVDVGEAWVDGDILYAHPTMPGKLTKVKPSVPNEVITIAIVLNAHVSNGTIVVRPTIDSHSTNVAKYTPVTGPAVSLQDHLHSVDASLSGLTGAITVDASHNVMIGTSSSTIASGNGVTALPSGSTYIGHATGTPSGALYSSFVYNGVPIGTISQSGTAAVAYNTASDHRLKINTRPLTNSGAFIDALRPKTWDWVTDGSPGVGFIAHEVQEVSPSTVVGTKDATLLQIYEVTPEIIDESGQVTASATLGQREVPVYQAMEYGSAEFIANIIAELQSLRQRVAALESS